MDRAAKLATGLPRLSDEMAKELRPRALSRSFALLLAIAMLVAACGGADSDAVAEPEAARLAAEARVVELEAQVADLETRLSGFVAEQDGADEAQANIQQLVGFNILAGYADDIGEDFVSLNMPGVAAVGEAAERLENLLAELGFPSSTMSRIGNTRALDGTQTAEGDNVTAYWTYHPDDGLSIVIERDT